MGNGADINFALQKDENDRISDYKGGVSFSIPGAGAGAGAEGHLTGSYSWLLVTYTWEEIMSKVGVIANQTGQDKETIEKGILAIQEQYGSLTKKTQESVQQKQTEASSQQKYTVQMGAFGSEKNAKRRADKYGGTIIEEGGLYKVIKEASSQDEADKIIQGVDDDKAFIR